MKKKCVNNSVVEMTYRDAVIEAIDAEAFNGLRPAMVVFISDDGRIELYGWNTDPACLLRDLAGIYCGIHDSFEEGH